MIKQERIKRPDARQARAPHHYRRHPAPPKDRRLESPARRK